jgi:uncharacterized protein YjiS (DUF1127 family)
LLALLAPFGDRFAVAKHQHPVSQAAHRLHDVFMIRRVMRRSRICRTTLAISSISDHGDGRAGGSAARPQAAKLQRCLAESLLPRACGEVYLESVTSSEREGIAMKEDRIARAYRIWRRYRDNYNELMRLSDRDLLDIGITRGLIPDLAKSYALR